MDKCKEKLKTRFNKFPGFQDEPTSMKREEAMRKVHKLTKYKFLVLDLRPFL